MGLADWLAQKALQLLRSELQLYKSIARQRTITLGTVIRNMITPDMIMRMEVYSTRMCMSLRKVPVN